MNIKAVYLVVIFTVLLSACQQGHETTQTIETKPKVTTTNEQSITSEPVREHADKLTRQVADSRKSRISNVAYTLDIDLISLADDYQGQVDITFELNNKSQNLTVDFTGGTVADVEVNGQEVAVNYSGYFITLPAESLQVGSNQVSITYSHPYGQDGNGLHRFIDPEDGETYIYTYLWPYYSNRLFPNFDQPNLKATYAMKVRAKADWQVVSAMQEDRIVNEGDDKVWYFPRSKKFSSYIFSLHAGPYKVWQDMADDVPIRLMARKTLAEHVPVDEWMGYTKMGLNHFKNYFDIPYPFEKYDQVLVPDFNIGAMENVAAVTFTENVIQRGPSNRFQRQRRAGIVLHEMAHMWFGNLVTKNWWNGLWLNESFATLMANMAVAKIPEFNDLWHDFYLSTNLRAITADKMVSTHPIEVPVPSSDDFFAVFDAITYQKGASVLNQLSHFVGQENFRLGVSEYLKTHAWGNTELVDFILAQAQQSGQPLTTWSKNWLYQAGVNRIQVEFNCIDNKISEFKVNQFASDDYPTLRSQRTQLALFNKSTGAVEPYHIKPINVTGASTPVNEVVGLECPYLAYPNYQGWGYAEVELDEVSKHNAFAAVTELKDPLLRSMLWTSLLADQQTDIAQVIETLELETNDRIINQVQTSLIAKFNQLGRQNDGLLDQVGPLFENLLWRQLTAEQTNENLRKVHLDSYLSAVGTSQGVGQLIGLLNGTITLPDLHISQDFRWKILHRLAVLNHPSIEIMLVAEKQLDSSDAGVLSAIAVESAIPDLSVKQKWVAHFMEKENPLPLSHQRKAMEAMFPANQVALQEQLLPELLAALPMMNQTRDNYYKRSYGRDLLAGICTESGLQQIKAALNKDQIGTTLYRFLSENVQKAEECVAGGL